jgi:hypothetical protein
MTDYDHAYRQELFRRRKYEHIERAFVDGASVVVIARAEDKAVGTIRAILSARGCFNEFDRQQIFIPRSLYEIYRKAGRDRGLRATEMIHEVLFQGIPK